MKIKFVFRLKCEMTIQFYLRAYFLLLVNFCFLCVAQKTHVILEQGTLAGLKIFPESSRTAVYAFLGIPYADPPIGELRFALPKPQNGWNGTLQAMKMRPLCPQLTNTIYDETTVASPSSYEHTMDEDCLYLNIWVSEASMRYGNRPVVVIITGEEMSIDWAHNRPTGLDFSLEGIIVVTVQYRSNIFGWINLRNNTDLSGNYGLNDQQLAMEWIQWNIQNFGGDPKQVTLLGHGTTGFTCAFLHMINPKSDHLFNKIILMSGNYEFIATTLAEGAESMPTASELLIQKLGCHFEKVNNEIIKCLRSKSVSDLLKAYESLYNNRNRTSSYLLGPSAIDVDVEKILTIGNFSSNRSMIIGICSNEGAFIQDYWIDLAREGSLTLKNFINNTALPRVLRLGRWAQQQQIANTLYWKYFEANVQEMNESSYLLNAMQRMFSEALYEGPFYRIIEMLAAKTTSSSNSSSFDIFAYVFHVSNSMDLRGRVNLFGGASHSADLPFLLGPTLFQQIARRRFNSAEEKICRQMKNKFGNFIKFGRPTLERGYNTWISYNLNRKFIQIIGESPESMTPSAGSIESLQTFYRNLPEIENLLEMKETKGVSRKNRNEYNNNPSPSLHGRSTKSASFDVNYRHHDFGYFFHLKDVYAFWNILLPNVISRADNDSNNAYAIINNVLEHRMQLLEASANAIRYKRGFFLLLVLVCFLLALLSICIYLLQCNRNSLTSSSTLFSSSEFCL